MDENPWPETCPSCGEMIPEVYDLRRRLVPWPPWHKDTNGRWCRYYVCKTPRNHPLFCACIRPRRWPERGYVHDTPERAQ
jgi:hypothetical protein